MVRVGVDGPGWVQIAQYLDGSARGALIEAVEDDAVCRFHCRFDAQVIRRCRAESRQFDLRLACQEFQLLNL